MTKNTLTQSRLKELLHYDPSTGIFTYKVTRARMVVGAIAGAMDNGYIRIKIDHKSYRAHRLAFLYILGDFPVAVDHKNQDRSDNRFENLRPANNSINAKNYTKRADNRSGMTGVHFDNPTQKWRAQIMVNNKKIYLGGYDTKHEAINAREVANIKYSFHQNHGNEKWPK